MKMFIFSKHYQNWVPVIGRIFLGIIFLVGAVWKIPGTGTFIQEVGFTQKVGVPLPYFAVLIAFFIELILGVSLIVGWKTKVSGFLLAIYTIILVLIFHFKFSNQMEIGEFLSHLALIGGLLYISVFGAGGYSIDNKKDQN